ncbi:3-deoxy-7-phosphoheptulonate synthase [Vallitalea longa]|uniref:3-deoxy-7-phosphoheptulonate synthase n=1 Tax=Vallitalea longa TaxID=2936439 RepID=A0A9W5YFU9_9FIRM|nr:3-deoxy-7-phosphoheptulonate synthase [Vallitalea longa]GKX31896.1 3-deoxy-7-phosphoheptulonate synthase [Vallitalea longa]
MSNLTDNKVIDLGGLRIGDDKHPIFIAGPCSVESEEHILKAAFFLKKLGVHVLRGGCFKPRTSPYDFQGLGLEGIKYLKQAGEKAKLPIITEVMEEKYIDVVSECTDIIQIGSRNMYNYPLLKALGHTKNPIMLKRGLSATVKEWIMAAEYIAMGGNDKIIMCERGIRTFNDYTRNTLDLAAVSIIKRETGRPVIVDPSHGTGRRELVGPMSKAALACGASGLMIEVHEEPAHALSDGNQSLDFPQFEKLIMELRSIVNEPKAM